MNTADDIQVVTFLVVTQEFAFDILQIERILRYEPPARLQQSPGFLEGMVQYGGGAVPVVDLRKRFELEAAIREETRLMIRDLGDQRVGGVVDEVRAVLCPAPLPTGSPAWMRRIASSLGTASEKLRPVLCLSPS